MNARIKRMPPPPDEKAMIQGTEDRLSYDVVEALGLDGTGRDGDPRFPYTRSKLTAEELTRLCQLEKRE